MRVFLSYSRRDTVLADGMVADLEAQGIEVDIDRRDLPYGEAWQAELAGFIHRADTIVWLASEASVASSWCKWELGEAQRLSKRLLPVRIAPLAPEALPEALGRIHVLPAEGVYDPARHLDDLVRAIQTDRAWMEMHTRLADRAAEWVVRQRPADRLLRGRALRDAEEWRDGRPERAPAPGSDTLDLILQSRRAATRTLRVLVAIAGVAVVVTLGLAATALLQANEARNQRDVARTAQQEAVTRAREAELQGARVATTLAPELARDGQLDAALLLLLAAHTTYGEDTAPAALDIAFHKVLEATHQRSAYNIPVGSVPFATATALYLFDPATADLWRYDGSGAPVRILAGTAGDAPVLAVGDGPHGLLLVRADLTVHRLFAGAARTEPAGALPPADGFAGALAPFDEIAIHPDGMVSFLHGEDGSLRLLDTASGARLHLDDMDRGRLFYYAPSPDRRLVVATDGAHGDAPPLIWDLQVAGDTLVRTPVPSSSDTALRGLFEECLRRGHGPPAAYRPAVIESMSYVNGQQICWAIGDGDVLLSDFSFTSTGRDREERLYMADGGVMEINSTPPFASSADQFSWVGVDPRAHAIAGIVNRDFVVASLDEGQLVQAFAGREPESPALGKLLAGQRLVLVEPRSGWLVVYRYPQAVRQTLVDASAPEILAGAPFHPLNAGTCVGYALDEAVDRNVTGPDGAGMRLAGSTLTTMKGAAAIELADGRRIVLGEEGSCLQLSPDRQTVLVHAGEGVVYDLPALLGGASLEAARGEAPPGRFSSIFPLADGGFLTADWSERVLRWARAADGAWSSSLVYSSEAPVIYAEPNADASQLLLIESQSDGDVAGVLYSVAARSRWLDLGSDYKWLGAAFGERGEIVIGVHFSPAEVWRLPSRQELAREAGTYLPAHCAVEGDAYRTSACWPDWL